MSHSLQIELARWAEAWRDHTTFRYYGNMYGQIYNCDNCRREDLESLNFDLISVVIIINARDTTMRVTRNTAYAVHHGSSRGTPVNEGPGST